MNVAVVGKGNVGGGLADLWERAGHDVTRIGKDGGDVADAERIGFPGVLAGPLVRSSYRAGRLYQQAIEARGLSRPA